MQIDYEKYARIFKVMSDPKRLKIIDMLWRRIMRLQDPGGISHHTADLIA